MSHTVEFAIFDHLVECSSLQSSFIAGCITRQQPNYLCNIRNHDVAESLTVLSMELDKLFSLFLGANSTNH